MHRMYRYLGLWKLAFQRFVAEPILTLCLLLGWIVVVALTSALPMYTDAVNRSLLQHELQATPTQSRPVFSFFYHFVGGSTGGAQWQNYQALDQYMAAGVIADLGLPHHARMHYVKSDLFQVFPMLGGSYEIRDQPLFRGYLGFIDQVDEHIRLIEGELPAASDRATTDSDALDVLISEPVAGELGLQVGEEYVLFDPSTISSQGAHGRLEIRLRIAGVWTPATSDDFWYIPPSSFNNVFLVAKPAYINDVSTRVPHAFFDVGWYQVFNGDSVRAENVSAFLRRVTTVDRRVKTLLPTAYLELSPVSALQRYQRVASAQAVLLLFFGIPVLGLVLYFIVLVADSTVKRQQTEIAILKSRGATSGQVFCIYLLQGLFLGALALIIGPLLGRLVARAIGGTYYFLTFRAQIPLDAVITTTSLRFALAALIMALLATVLPALGASRLTIVEVKREISRAQRRPLWERAYLDMLLLGVAGYGYYLLKTQGRIAFLQPNIPTDPLENPLLFLAPAFFILATALFFARMFPILARLLSWLWSRVGGVAMLLALYNLARTSRAYTNLLLLLILTTSLGTFTASMARTLDANLVARTFYQIGADMALTEGAALRTVESQTANAAGAVEDESIWISLPVDDHRRAPGVKAATRIGEFEVSTQAGNQLIQGILYGIDRSDFPEVAYFRPDFAAQSLGALMNQLALDYAGVIVSRSVLDALGLSIGDPIALRGLIPTSNAAVTFTVVGEMALFPTAYPEDGAFFVANLDYIFQELGQELPYRVWLATEESVALHEITASLDELGYKVLAVEDARTQISEAQGRPERIGVFGFLSVGFITIALLSMLALMIYTVLSFRQRFIQLGILRAIGLSTGQLILSLGGEQILITATGIAFGSYLGLLSSYMFIPFLQIGYKQTELVPPFIVHIAWSDVAMLVVALVIMLLVATASMIWLLMHMQTFQAVKLGEVLT